MRIQRTYPQPDAPEPHIGPRERALAIFRYLEEYQLEPEEASKHPLFELVMAAFRAAERRGWNQAIRYTEVMKTNAPKQEDPPSMVELLSSGKTLEWRVRPFEASQQSAPAGEYRPTVPTYPHPCKLELSFPKKDLDDQVRLSNEIVDELIAEERAAEPPTKPEDATGSAGWAPDGL